MAWHIIENAQGGDEAEPLECPLPNFENIVVAEVAAHSQIEWSEGSPRSWHPFRASISAAPSFRLLLLLLLLLLSLSLYAPCFFKKFSRLRALSPAQLTSPHPVRSPID